MSTELGRIEALFRYPVKSMRGEPLRRVALGWHGIAGDRRLALRRLDERGGFPWLTASKLPELVQFTPHGPDDDALPTHVRTPEGDDLPVMGDALAGEIGRRFGHPVEMMRLDHGIFDDGTISVIATATVDEICRLAGTATDIRRFRPNIVVRTTRAVAFEEDDWVGSTLGFGDADDAPSIVVTMRDERCVMINFDPDGGKHAPEMMKAAVRANDNFAGIYGSVTRRGQLAVGQPVVISRRGSS